MSWQLGGDTAIDCPYFSGKDIGLSSQPPRPPPGMKYLLCGLASAEVTAGHLSADTVGGKVTFIALYKAFILFEICSEPY